MDSIILKEGASYTSPYSDLLVKVHRIYHISSTGYIKARISITNAKNGIFYELKTYKLLLSDIAGKEWAEL